MYIPALTLRPISSHSLSRLTGVSTAEKQDRRKHPQGQQADVQHKGQCPVHVAQKAADVPEGDADQHHRGLQERHDP